MSDIVTDLEQLVQELKTAGEEELATVIDSLTQSVNAAVNKLDAIADTKAREATAAATPDVATEPAPANPTAGQPQAPVGAPQPVVTPPVEDETNVNEEPDNGTPSPSQPTSPTTSDGVAATPTTEPAPSAGTAPAA